MFTHRALVTYSNAVTGEIRVKIPAIIGIDEVGVSYFGRESSGDVWQVPSPGEEVIVSSDDENLSNVFLLSANPVPPPVTVSTGEPTGFPSRSDNQISFDNTTRTFTISPIGTSYYVWCKGNRFTIMAPLSVIIPNTTGTYFFYFDSTGTLQYSTTPFDIENTAPVALLYWRSVSSTAVFFGDERHGIVMDWQTHEYLHRTRGAAYANGFGISNYTTNGTGSASSSLTFDIANGTFFDEDIEINITHSATPVANTWQQRLQNGAYVPVVYKDANGWEEDTATQFPVKFAPGGYPYYNSGSSLVQMANNRYGVSWIVATNGVTEPVIAIMGQAEYSNIADAENVLWESLVITDLPVYEFRPLWKIVFQAQNNTYKAAIREVIDLRITALNTQVSAVTTPSMPTGSVISFAGSTAPSEWLLCAGQAVSRTTYSGLFNVIGTTYGSGDGSTTFNIPDLRGRTTAGLDNMNGTDAGRLDWANTLGTAGGLQTHTLTSTEMPFHHHDIHRNAGSTISFTPGGTVSPPFYTPTQNSGTSWGSTQAAGGGGAHNNMQPTILLNYIIKI